MRVWGKLAEERISNMRTVRAFGKELSEVRAYRQKTDEVFSLAKKEALIRAGFYGVVSANPLKKNVHFIRHFQVFMKDYDVKAYKR